MKNKFILSLLALTLHFLSFSQNPVRIIAPKYINQFSVDVPLPVGPGSNDYHGQKAECASNAMCDAQGDLKFFIIDNKVFDHQGYLIEEIISNFGLTMGRSEISIVKDPGSCERFYIFTMAREYNLISDGDYILYKVIDFSLSSPFNSSRMGAIVEEAALNSSVNGKGNAHFAITKPREDGSHLIFLSDGPFLKVFQLDNSGITNTGLVQNSGGSFVDTQIRAEMEVFEIPNGFPVRYRVAMPFYKEETIGPNAILTYAIYLANLDENGNLLTYNTFNYIIEIDPMTDERVPFLKGLEFDPSGQYLFISHTANTAVGYPQAIDFVDFSLPFQNISPLNLPGNTDFEYSQIEYMNINGQPGLYMATENSFGRIVTDPIPANIQLQLNVFPVGVPASYMTVDQYGWSTNTTNSYKSFLLPDQIDSYAYLDFYDTPNASQCCVLNTSFDKNTFSASTNATWLPGFNNNPVDAVNDGNDDITISHELRIPAGKLVTIKDMTIKFAPGAKLIIEEGNGPLSGGRLILNNSILTVDGRCDDNTLWEGVEVWGKNTVAQTSINAASQQGRLIIQNGSIIEHAKRAVILTQFDPIVANYVTSKCGGIISAQNSIFRNNQRDIVLWNYISPSGINNLSTIVNCEFVNDAPLLGGVNIINHIEMRSVKGVQVSGCTFKHAASGPYQQKGNGIFATNSTFNANGRCTSFTSPCTSYDPNIFDKLQFGIYTNNSNTSTTFSANNNVFNDNIYGIYANGTTLASITKNTFKVFESNDPAEETAGIRMRGSTGYVIEENDFSVNALVPNPLSKTYGVVIANSGILANLVYKNNFQKLYIGGQAEGTNANTQIGNATGLVWKCNSFKDPMKGHDLSVNKGSVAYNQGYMDPGNVIQANKKAANNLFSMQGEAPSLEHDYVLIGASPINYVYTTSGVTIPDSYTSGLMAIEQSQVGGTPVVLNYATGCPSNLGKGKQQLQIELNQLQAHLNDDLQLVENGNSTTLQTLLTTGSSGAKKNALIAASPYLSDEILLQYINSNPPAGNLQQVLLANSPLSPEVLEVVNGLTLPNGVLNSILASQTGVNALEILEQDILYTNDLLYRNIDDQLREVLLDTLETRDFSDAVSILELRPEKFYQEILLNLRLLQQETSTATSLLSTVGTYGRTEDINQVQIAMVSSADVNTYLAANPIAIATLMDVKADSSFCICSARAASLLCQLNGYNFEDDILDIIPMSQRSALIDNQNSIVQVERTIEIYPNPSEGFVIVQNNGLEGIIKVTSIQGQLVGEFMTTPESTVLDLSSLKNGIYIIQLVDGQSQQVYQRSWVKK